jgi:predicted acetyltransferase
MGAVAYRVRTVRDLDEFRAATGAIGHYFGWVPTEEDAERFARLLPLERLHAAFEGREVVAGAGAFPFELTVPGGPVRCAGITVVGVLPTHRRRGLLRRLMTAQLADVHERGEPLAALWASEETIYGRFGYGLASMQLMVAAERAQAALRQDLPAREGQVRLIDAEEALRRLPPIYERVRRRCTGFLSRSRAWWEQRILADRPEWRRGAGPLNRAVLELDGRPAGYALYRLAQEGSGIDWRETIRVQEAFGVSDGATREIWRFLLEVDWTDRLEIWRLPVDHPLLLLTTRLNALRATVQDGLWLRLVDVGSALAGRSYRVDGRVTIDVTYDELLAGNVGTWTIDGGDVRRTRRRPDVRLGVGALGAAYLGGFSFAELARTGLVEEDARGGIARADALFATSEKPWCPENF